MSGIGVLLGLLVIAYVGSILVSGRTIRGFGLPSGAEYLILGVVVGPHALGVVERSAIVTFEPVLMVGISWLALGFRRVGKRAIHPGRAALGILLSLFVAAIVAATAFLVASHDDLLPPGDLGWASLGAGMVACETTRHTIRWVAERHGARGPLSDLLADMARASAVVPIGILAFICAALPAESNYYTSLSARLGITVGVGVILGAVVAVLLGREFRQQESWGLMIGTSLLGMGIASRLGLSPLGTCFVLGLTISIVSRHHSDIRALVQPTEKPVMLPILLAGGVYLDFDLLRGAAPLIVAVVVARLLSDLLRGFALNVATPTARG
jgi:Kef-type K+ transport system membrane component KefB